MNTIRTHVAKPTVIGFMSPILAGVSVVSAIISSIVLALVTPIPWILAVIGCAIVFVLGSMSLTFIEPHIDRVILNALLRISCAVGLHWPGYPRLSTKNYWPTSNAEFNA